MSKEFERDFRTLGSDSLALRAYVAVTRCLDPSRRILEILVMERQILAKQVLFPNKTPRSWFGIDYQLNLYRGCTHGCIYCDSRSECYQNEPFDVVRYKGNAIELLSAELASKPKHRIIGFGSMSDPYNPLEHDLELTRQRARDDPLSQATAS
ncbi:MAG: hypothetical protein MZU97_01460 [Bacillus subtilis]|nr:hypothetical protein [Bacillus subtilis]